MWVWDPENISGSRDQKGTGSWIRIRNTDYESFECSTTQVPERLHRDPGPAERDGGGPVADAVGAQLHHRRHAHQAQGDGQGKLLCLAGRAFSLLG